MEDQNKNLILATVLSLAVIVGWTYFFAPEPPVVDPNAPVSEQVASPAAPNIAPTPSATATATAAATAAEAATENELANAPRIAINTDSLEGSISLLGGRVDDLLLKDYKETLAGDSPDVRLLAPVGATELNAAKPYYAVYGWLPTAGGVDPALLPGARTLWTLESGDTLAPGKPITLAWDNGAGLVFHRTISIDDKYLFTVEQSVQNNTGAAVRLAPYGIVARHGKPDTQNFYVLHEGAVRMSDGKLEEIKYKDIAKLDPVEGEGQAEVISVGSNGWTGFTDKYWMTTLAPKSGQPFTSVIKYSASADIYQTEARLPVMDVAAGASASVSTMLFSGAKEWETIKAYENNPGWFAQVLGDKYDPNEPQILGFVDSIDWGWFYFFTKPMFWLLHALHGLIGNMGLAIIALTFIIKMLVFPLARKSYISMAKMKELQPEMEKLKERAGDDRAKMQQEMMALYKREKVNPASGCLPMLIQIPIFFSLYKVIFVTIELRHAPFFGWLRDLSAPDPSSILNLFGMLPFAAPDAGSLLHVISLGVLPILLGISMWFQQKLNPAPTDPAQKMIFAWMPWVFMFMLGQFASGLVLYWICNNTITFIQQYTIMTLHGKRPDLFGNIFSGRNTAATPKK